MRCRESVCPRRSRRAWSTALAIAAVVLGSSASAGLFQAQHGEIGFTASQAEVPIAGAFKRFSADVDFDPAQPAAGKVSIVIDTASVDTGSADADMLLQGPDFFDVARFPSASFTSTAIVADAAGGFRASGELTLKGRSLPLVVPFSARRDGDALRFEGSVSLSRLAYQVGSGEWSDTGTLADPVLIRFKLGSQ
jgi:polyisoprenoid-binding protein YceI